MSHRLPFVAGASLLLLLLIAPRSEAQTIPSPYEFIDGSQEYGLTVGMASTQRGQLDLGPGGGTVFGARFGLQISGPLGLEANTFLLPTDRFVRVPGEESGIEDLGVADALIAGIDARIRFSLTGNRTWHSLAPYLTAGGGVAFDFAGRSELEAEIPESVRFSFGPSFLGILGTGVRWLPTDRLTVRGEIAVNYWKNGTPEAFLQRGDEAIGQPVPEQEWTPVQILTIGLSYRR
ncbi:MAG: hypothetical protein EA351_03080 [Gemmatimonadales bacterium]|nr:MAG: hypothetical protein EA351_03080 [Gemmatimonadales bacterium]